MWGADEELARRHHPERERERNSHKENALCGNKKMRNTKIYTVVVCRVRERRTRVKLTIRHKKHGKHSSSIRISRACARAGIQVWKQKNVPSISLSPPFHHVKAIWRTDGRERNQRRSFNCAPHSAVLPCDFASLISFDYAAAHRLQKNKTPRTFRP